jgi:hypothetical protein
MAALFSLCSAALLLSACVGVLFYASLAPVQQKRTRVENLAILPNFQGPQFRAYNFTNGQHVANLVEWIEVSYPSDGVFHSQDVTMKNLSAHDAIIPSSWLDANIGEKGAMLTGRVFKDDLYILTNQGHSPIFRGCCGDTLRVFLGGDGSTRDIRLDDVFRKAAESIDGVEFVGISHSFHPFEMHGSTMFLFIIIIKDARLGGAITDAFIAVDVATVTVFPTADGAVAWIPFREIGTFDISRPGTIFNVQYKAIGQSIMQQWHANGVCFFTMRDGTNVMAFSQRMDIEAVLIRNPYMHSKAEGGGHVLQRFGSPRFFDDSQGQLHRDAGRHNFGIKAPDQLPMVPGKPRLSLKAQGGIHNLFFYTHPDGRETLTIFCNEIRGANQSGVIEFDVKLVKERISSPTETVFDTKYTLVPLPFVAMAQGGARPLGNGVYMVASGLAGEGFLVVDTSGGSKLFKYTTRFMYDPFVFVSYIKNGSDMISLGDAPSQLSLRYVAISVSVFLAAVLLSSLSKSARHAWTLGQEVQDEHYLQL